MTQINIIYYPSKPYKEEANNFEVLLDEGREGAGVYVVADEEFQPFLEQSSRSMDFIHRILDPCIKNAFAAFNVAFDRIERKELPVLFMTDEVEIDWEIIRELRDILDLNEKHGIVSPRIRVQKGLEYLPRYTIVSTFTPFCFLIRGQLIVNFGGFDTSDVFEVNRCRDLAVRVNKYGYSTLVANHAVAGSSGQKNKDLEQIDWRTDSVLFSRYPYYQKIEDIYSSLDNNPIDHFSTILNYPADQKKKILFSLYNALPFYSGSAVHSLKELGGFYKQFAEKYEIHVLINRHADAFFGVSSKYYTVVYPDTISEQYHLAFSPTQFFHLEHLMLLHRHALRILFTMQDIIGLRCAYNMAPNPEIKFIFNMAIKYADGICTFSDYAAKDIRSYFNADLFQPLPKFRTIYLGADQIPDVRETADKLPFERYILIFGNHFAHKSILETMNVVMDKGTERNFIIVGLPEDFFQQPNIRTFPSGALEDSFVRTLYANADALLFSSQYEGFGLPIVEALQFGKPVILFNTELNRELFSDLLQDCEENALFFDTFDELPGILNRLDELFEKRALKCLPDTFRNWNDVARDIESVMDELLNEPVDHRKLEERFFHLQALDHFHSDAGPQRDAARSFPAQLFIDTGKGYTESESLTQWTTPDTSRLEFDLRKFPNVRNIRFDPMNIYGLISLKSIQLVLPDDRIVDLGVRSHNARKVSGRIYLFDTDDANIEFGIHEPGQFKKLLISLHYLAVGQSAYAYMYRHQMGSIMFSEAMHELHQWKHWFKNKFF